MHLMPSQVGVSLITVLPEQLQSPLLTAEWEHRLKEVERGELSPGEFMDGITEGVQELVKSYEIIPGAEVLFPSGREVVGKCPRCGGSIRPDVVLYGEPLDDDVVQSALDAIRRCDLLIVGGTSLVVHPAAGFITYRKADARLALINRDATAYDEEAVLVIREDIAEVLEAAVE